jgi:hypothetical protein
MGQKEAIDIWREKTKHLSWGESQLCQNPGLEAMDEWARVMVVRFQHYLEKFRIEERRSVKKEQDRIGGMFSWIGKKVEDVYDDFIEKKPIRCYLLPEPTYWQYNDKGVLALFREYDNSPI